MAETQSLNRSMSVDSTEARDVMPSPVKKMQQFWEGTGTTPNGSDLIREEKTADSGRDRTSSAASVASLSSISLAPDATLDGMKVVLQKELPKISVDRFYETFWAPSDFMLQWLTKEEGKSNVQVLPWRQQEASSSDAVTPIVNPYDQETYDQIRTITFSYNRSTSVYSGPVEVTWTQYCRRVRKQRCIVASTLQFQGAMPYARAFRVHSRWVASRRQKVNLKVQVGLAVQFMEQVLVASQIKVNTMLEMREMHSSLFRCMKQTLGISDVDVVAKANPVQKGVAVLFPFVAPKNDAQLRLAEAQAKMRRVQALPTKSEEDEAEDQKEYCVEELDTVHEALDAILLRKYNQREFQKMSFPDKTVDELPPVLRVLASANKNLQHWSDGVLRKLSPRLVTVRDPTAFGRKAGTDYLDLQRRDKTLSKMEVIVSSTIPEVSLEDFASVFLTDEAGQGGFYEHWMSETSRNNIEIGPWQDEDELEEVIVEDYSGESFSKRRNIKATFHKHEFLGEGVGQGPESVQIQDQYFRHDEKTQRIVFASTTKVEKIPFAESFEVHTRWVVTQLRTAELSVKVGLFVVFKKQALLEPRLKAVATKEGRRTQSDLFQKVRKVLGKIHEERNAQEILALSEYLTPTPNLVDVCSSLPLNFCRPMNRNDTIQDDPLLREEFENADLKLRAVKIFLKDCQDKEDTETLKFILGELNVVTDALNHLLVSHGDGGSEEALAMGSFQ